MEQVGQYVPLGLQLFEDIFMGLLMGQTHISTYANTRSNEPSDNSQRSTDNSLGNRSETTATSEKCVRTTFDQRTVREVVPYNEQFAKQQKRSHWGICAWCLAEGYGKKKCTRCQRTKYCNKDCQRQHFQRHKEFCKNVAKFTDAESRIDPNLKKEFFCRLEFMQISYFLGSIPNQERYMATGPRICVLVEILEFILTPNPTLFGVKVKDVENQTTEIFFDGPKVFPILPTFQGFANLHNVLTGYSTPGNFILITNACWSVVGMKSGMIMINQPYKMFLIRMK